MPEEKIRGIESVLTIVGGKIVHATDEFAAHAPPPIPVLPEWSPAKYFGGYGAPLDVRQAAHGLECRWNSINTIQSAVTTPKRAKIVTPDFGEAVATASPFLSQ